MDIHEYPGFGICIKIEITNLNHYIFFKYNYFRTLTDCNKL